MEKDLIVANWKENKTVDEAKEWVEKLSSKFIRQRRFFESKVQSSKLEVVVCPSFVVLPMMAYEVSKLEGFKLGAQDVSKFEEGSYTGEVSARMLKDFVSYVIVGHSERREHFGETDRDVARKSVLALKYGLIPIVCVTSVKEAGNWRVEAGKEDRSLKLDVAIFAYEPLFAVGTGEPDTPENAQKFAEKIKSEVGQNVRVLYGGSVDSENVESFVRQPDINGVLVGQASLDAVEFSRIIFNAF